MSDTNKNPCMAADYPIILLKVIPDLEDSLMGLFCNERFGTNDSSSRALTKALLWFSTSSPAFYDRTFQTIRFLLDQQEESTTSYNHVTVLDTIMIMFHVLSLADLDRQGLVRKRDLFLENKVKPVPTSCAVSSEKVKDSYLVYRSKPANVQSETRRKLLGAFAEVERAIGFDAISSAVVTSIPGIESSVGNEACPIGSACPIFRKLMNEINESLMEMVRYDFRTHWSPDPWPDARIVLEAVNKLSNIAISQGSSSAEDRSLSVTELANRLQDKSSSLLSTMMTAFKERSDFCHEMRALADMLNQACGGVRSRRAFA